MFILKKKYRLDKCCCGGCEWERKPFWPSFTLSWWLQLCFNPGGPLGSGGLYAVFLCACSFRRKQNILQPQQLPPAFRKLCFQNINDFFLSTSERRFCSLRSSRLHLNYFFCLNCERQVQPLCSSPKWQIKTNLDGVYRLANIQTVENDLVFSARILSPGGSSS